MKDPLEALLVDIPFSPEAMLLRAIAIVNGLSDADCAKLREIAIEAIRAAEQAQMERDCAAVCSFCRRGEELILVDADWCHAWREDSLKACGGSDIRAAFAAAHAEPAA